MRHLGHDLGLQILVDDQVPSKFTVTDESEEIAMDSLEDVAELLEAKRKERVIYDDGFVVVYCHPNFAMTAINGDSREVRNATKAIEWSLYAHDAGAMLQFDIDSSAWVLTGDVTGLLGAGVADQRKQWALLHTKLNGAIGNSDKVIPFIADIDAYTTKYGIGKFVSSKLPRHAMSVDTIEMPVIQASIVQHHEFKEMWQFDGSADLAVAVAQSLNININWEVDFSIEEVFALVAQGLKKHKVKTIILHDPHYLGFGHNHDSMLESLIKRAQSWGCQIVLVGNIEFCWNLRASTKTIDFEIITPKKPSYLSPLFFDELRQLTRRLSYGVELDLTHEVGALIWDASGGDRATAIELCRSLAFYCNGTEENMSKSAIERMTQNTLV